MARSIRSRFVVSGDEFTLAGVDPASSAGVRDKHVAQNAVQALRAGLQEQQTRLYADREKSLLLILQGMDACGKDGVVRNVAGLFYPTSVYVSAFKAPSAEERKHDFLWRFGPTMPQPGNIAVFNRSQYEDVGTVKVHGTAAPDVIEARYGQINDFERDAAAAGTVIVKCFLHVSYAQQGLRMLDRLADPTKRWKFKAADLDERALWAEYMAAYDIALRRCSNEDAPWYVIPADHKWYRDWAVANILAETLATLNLAYPDSTDLDIPALTRRIKDS